MLVRSKLNSIGTMVSKTPIDDEISHEEFTNIIIEEKN